MMVSRPLWVSVAIIEGFPRFAAEFELPVFHLTDERLIEKRQKEART